MLHAGQVVICDELTISKPSSCHAYLKMFYTLSAYLSVMQNHK